MSRSDLIGYRTRFLIVIADVPKSGRRRYVKVRCDCGVVFDVLAQNIKNGNTISCGCYGKIKSITHGMRNTSTYSVWRGMKKRCSNSNSVYFKNYGGRGIFVCDRWMESFENFLSDMGERPSRCFTLDRIDNNKGYCPNNCRWTDWKTQERNRRNTIMLTLCGVTRSVSEWAEVTGIPYGALKSRLRMGWSDERTLTEPLRKLRKADPVKAKTYGIKPGI